MGFIRVIFFIINTLIVIKAQGQSIKRPQTPKPPFNYNIKHVAFINSVEGNTLAGTLTTPRNSDNFPIVILISGTGKQNRDYYYQGHVPFFVIADHLAKNRIGTLRIDDRGVNGSSVGKLNATAEDDAGNINAAINYLDSLGFKNIGLVGHSEGGMIAPMIAANNSKIRFVILLAAPGVLTEKLLLLQTIAIRKADGISLKIVDAHLKMNRKVYAAVKELDGMVLKRELISIYQDAFKETPDLASGEKIKIAELINSLAEKNSTKRFKYYLQFNPQLYLQKVKIPVLAINGSKDTQVTPKENLSGIKTALQKAGNKNFKIVELEGLNHGFQEAKTGSPVEYGQIEQTISPKVLDLMTEWILKLK